MKAAVNGGNKVAAFWIVSCSIDISSVSQANFMILMRISLGTERMHTTGSILREKGWSAMMIKTDARF